MLCLLFVTRWQFQSGRSSPTNSATNAGSTTLDPRRICAGQLAEELLRLTGIAVSTVPADKLKALYNALEPYDKKAIEVHLRS